MASVLVSTARWALLLVSLAWLGAVDLPPGVSLDGVDTGSLSAANRPTPVQAAPDEADLMRTATRPQVGEAAQWRSRSTQLPVFGAQLLSQPLPEGSVQTMPPGMPGDTASTNPLAKLRPAPVSAAVGHRLQPGDRVRLVTWGGPTVNAALPITPMGQLAIPGYGVLPVAGMTREDAQAAVVSLLQDHFKEAGAILAVEQSAGHIVTVLGEVHRPGAQAVPSGATIIEVLRAAGGALRRGSLRTIDVLSPEGENRSIDLYDALAGRNLAALQPLGAGSLVAVPLAGPQVQVFGAVRRSYTFELADTASLSQALHWAGGLQPAADPLRVRLLRESDEGQDLIVCTVNDLADIDARDGDRLYIGTRAGLDDRYASVAAEGAVRAPGTYPLTDGMTVSDLLSLSGGVTPRADIERAIIVRHLERPSRLQLNDDTTINVYEDLLTGVDSDTALQARDRLVVPVRPNLEETTLQVSISGAVRRPSTYPLVPGMTVGDLVRLAGGITAAAQVDEADLVRVTEHDGRRDVTRRAIDLRPILNNEVDGPVLRNGDAVVVRARTDQRVRVVLEGETENNGEYVFPAGTTLGQALTIAGGLTDWAFPHGAKFYRESEAEVTAKHLDMLMRQVSQAQAINEQKLASATDQAGAEMLRQTIISQELELERMQRAQATGRMAGVDLPGILNGIPGSDFPLQDGDKLVVPKHPGTVRVLGQVMTPGSLRFEPDLKVRTVIERAGGLTQQADEDRIFVVRANGSVVASAAYTGTAWNADERKWVRTHLKTITLREGDAVLVPPDLQYHPSGLVIAKDVSQILFQVAAAVGTIAVLNN